MWSPLRSIESEQVGQAAIESVLQLAQCPLVLCNDPHRREHTAFVVEALGSVHTTYATTHIHVQLQYISEFHRANIEGDNEQEPEQAHIEERPVQDDIDTDVAFQCATASVQAFDDCVQSKCGRQERRFRWDDNNDWQKCRKQLHVHRNLFRWFEPVELDGRMYRPGFVGQKPLSTKVHNYHARLFAFFVVDFDWCISK